MNIISSEIPRYLYILEYFQNNEISNAYIMAGCVEEAIQKFRDEGFENEIYSIVKSKARHLIY